MGKVSVAGKSGGGTSYHILSSLARASNSSYAGNWREESCVEENPYVVIPEKYKVILFYCGRSLSASMGTIINDVVTVNLITQDGTLDVYPWPCMLDAQRRLRCMGDSQTHVALYAVVLE